MYLFEAVKSDRLLADALDIPRNTVWRWVNGKATPGGEMLQRLADFFDVPVDELLNGPTDEGYKVTLKYVKTLEGVNDEMLVKGMELTVSEDGYVGVAGRAKFETHDDIEKALDKIRMFMEEGYESRERMAEKAKKLEGGA